MGNAFHRCHTYTVTVLGTQALARHRTMLTKGNYIPTAQGRAFLAIFTLGIAMDALATRAEKSNSDTRVRTGACWGGPHREALTFWLWLCRANCSSAVERAGPLSRGMAGGAPRRPGRERHGWVCCDNPPPTQPPVLGRTEMGGSEGSRKEGWVSSCCKFCSL